MGNSGLTPDVLDGKQVIESFITNIQSSSADGETTSLQFVESMVRAMQGSLKGAGQGAQLGSKRKFHKEATSDDIRRIHDLVFGE